MDQPTSTDSAAASSTRDAHYSQGVVMVLSAGFCLSLGGVLLRLLESAGGWQVLFYRSVSFALTILVVVALRDRGRLAESFRSIGRAGLVAGAISGASSICYIFALLTTTVANVMFIISVTPLCTALLAWAALGERPRLATWLAIAAAAGGIALMFAHGVTEARLMGSLLAFGAALGLAVMIVIIRRAKAVDMLPAQFVSGVAAAAVAALMVESFAVTAPDFGFLVLLGVVQIGAGFSLITLGARYVPAAQVSLLALSEMVLAPIWVWFAVDEVPAMLTLAGGAVVFTAVVGQALAGLREERAQRLDRSA